EIKEQFELAKEAFSRLSRLIEASREGTSTSDDILRAVVVLTHAYLEDFLRTIATRLLPVADEKTLNQVPLVGCAGDKGKFTLGKLAQYRGKMVDDVLRASVEEYLERSNFNSTTEIVSLLEDRLGLVLEASEKEKDLPLLNRMIQ